MTDPFRYKVSVSHVAPPVPSRDFDYQARVDDYEDDSPVGHGRTPGAALVELIESLSEDADPALADAVVQMLEDQIEQASAAGRSEDFIAGIRHAAKAVEGSLT